MKAKMKLSSLIMLCLLVTLLFVGCGKALQIDNLPNGTSMPETSNSSVPNKMKSGLDSGVVTAVSGNSIIIKLTDSVRPGDVIPTGNPSTPNPDRPQSTGPLVRGTPRNLGEKTITIPDNAPISSFIDSSLQNIKVSDIQPGDVITIMYAEDGKTITKVMIEPTNENGNMVPLVSPSP